MFEHLGRGLFLAGIPCEPLGAAARGLNFGNKGGKQFPSAAAHHDMKPTFGKSPGNGSTDVVSGTDDQTDGLCGHIVTLCCFCRLEGRAGL